MAQVTTYMYAVPLVCPTLVRLNGRLVHSDGTEIHIPSTAIGDDFRDVLHDLIMGVV